MNALSDVVMVDMLNKIYRTTNFATTESPPLPLKHTTRMRCLNANLTFRRLAVQFYPALRCFFRRIARIRLQKMPWSE
jgi:hypothetical protein